MNSNPSATTAISSSPSNSIRQRARLALGVLWAAMTFMAIIGAAGLATNLGKISNLAKTVERSHTQIYPLATLAYRIQFDVAQVQQWLSDISATRGQDGLTDGFAKAEEFARQFTLDLAELTKAAKALELHDLLRTLEEAGRIFPAYYESGKTMARAYVADGPGAGNKLMKDFDLQAEKIQHLIDKSVAVTGTLTEAEIDAVIQEEQAALRSMIITLVILSLCGAICVGLLFGIGRYAHHVINLITRAGEILHHASKGDLNVRITRIGSHDELGQLLHNTNRVLDLTEAFAKEAGAAMAAAACKDYYRTIPEEGLRGEFLVYATRINAVLHAMEQRDGETIRFSDERVAPIVRVVGDRTMGLRDSAHQLMEIANETIQRTMLVASAAEEATVNVQTVASAAVELTASINEINRQVGESSRLADDAVGEVERTNSTVEGLNAAAQRIGDVVKLIQDIANQTNLLALNATIEAARAGEAGKGFAVVAGEVKNLANQTASATEDISAQVDEMRAIVSETVRAIQHIGQMIAGINANIGSVAASVAAQDSATAEISRSVQEAATGTRDVAQNINVVASGAKETEEMARTVQDAADELSTEAETLNHDMDSFLSKIRGAS